MAKQDDLLKAAEEKMKAALKDLEHQLNTLRTGRATPALLDSVRVDVYGTQKPIVAVAQVNVLDAHTLQIQPWDTSNLKAIDHAIQAANLGVTPTNDGRVIRLVMPQLTEERRKELVKKGHALAEQHRVSVRNSRRDGKEHLEALGKPKRKGDAPELPEDLLKKSLDRLQKLTDEHIKKVDEILAKKEKEIMTV